MNYKKIYEDLINRGRVRTFTDTYYERHHVIPRCMGGTDDPSNLVNLTPEEHYIAHQLLVKIFPENRKIINAAIGMIPNRPSNKLYGWLRRRFSQSQSSLFKEHGGPTKDKRWISNDNETILVEKDLANTMILDGKYIAGKVATIAPCGHLVRLRCVSCENLPRKAYDEKKRETAKMANDLFFEFKQSTYGSVCEFAKSKNTSQPRLSMLWKKYVEEYRQSSKHGVKFK
jgi:hypothetical protein